MILLTRKAEFSAAHYYWNDAWSEAENQRVFGKCANRNGHGHNYTLEVTVAGKVDPQTGFVVDLKQLKDVMHREVVDVYDHRHLNLEVPEFRERVPTVENIAVSAWERLDGKIPGAKLERVRVYEMPDLYADCFGPEGEAMNVTFTRRYHFSASHRLDCAALSPEENRNVYGKCNNPHGHGHNYRLEVSVRGPVDRSTGMVMNMADLDALVASSVVERFHLANLNMDALFAREVPTTENLCRAIYRVLASELPQGKLDRIRIEETENNFFEYAGEGTRG